MEPLGDESLDVFFSRSPGFLMINGTDRSGKILFRGEVYVRIDPTETSNISQIQIKTFNNTFAFRFNSTKTQLLRTDDLTVAIEAMKNVLQIQTNITTMNRIGEWMTRQTAGVLNKIMKSRIAGCILPQSPRMLRVCRDMMIGLSAARSLRSREAMLMKKALATMAKKSSPNLLNPRESPK